MNKTIFILFLIPALIFAACGEKTRVIKVSPDDTAWLGVGVADLSKKMLGNLNLEYGVRVTKVYPNSPAEKSGIESDDILIKFDGEKITDSEELVDLVKKTEVDKKVSVEFVREGQTKVVDVTIGERDISVWSFKRPPRAMRFYKESKTWLGVRTENMTEQLRSYFGAPEGTGILIEEVIEDSPAEEAGLRAGDVLIRVDKKEINDSKDLQRAVNYFEPEDEVEIEIIRGKSRKELTVKLGEKESEFRFHRHGFVHPDVNFSVPDIPDFEVIIPEIEVFPEDIEIDPEDMEVIEEKIGKEIELKLQGLDESLNKLDNKIKKISIRIKSLTI